MNETRSPPLNDDDPTLICGHGLGHQPQYHGLGVVFICRIRVRVFIYLMVVYSTLIALVSVSQSVVSGQARHVLPRNTDHRF